MQQFTFDIFMKICACESLSEALILASINPHYDNRLFVELPWKLQAQNFGRTCSALVVFMVIPWANFLSYCGLVDARISASENDLPVHLMHMWFHAQVSQKILNDI